MKENNCSILIQSCDSYSDVWEPFFCTFAEYWKNCKYPIFLNTETKKYSYETLNIECLNVINEINIPWGKRLLDCLNRIESDYVISLFDDFVLNDYVNQDKIEEYINYMENNEDINVIYLNNAFPDLEKKSELIEVPIGKDFRLNSAPALWRKEKLIEYTGNIDTPWAWEYFGTMRTEKKNTVFLTLGTQPDIYRYNYNLGGAIHGGKWVGSVINPVIEKFNMKIDTSIRGYEDENKKNYNHSLSWNIKFFIIGFKMVGFKAFRFWHRMNITILKCAFNKIFRMLKWQK